MADEVLDLHVEGERIVGVVALDLSPGTRSGAQDKQLDEVLGPALTDLARELDCVLGAAASTFAKPMGKHEDGRARFLVHGRVEGDRLVPVRAAGRLPPPPSSRPGKKR